MSSSAFFIEAAANTVRLLSCASASEWGAPNRIVRATRIPARRCIGRSMRIRGERARKSGVGWTSVRRAEAPFQQSRRLTVPQDIAGRQKQAHNEGKGLLLRGRHGGGDRILVRS